MQKNQMTVIGSRQNLRAELDKANVRLTLQRVATRWLSADQLKTQALIAVARNPKLLNCSPASFLESMVRAGELGLRFAGAGGEAYLVPYGRTCSLIVGYRGLCALARRTGKVTRIEARAVHEKDEFKVTYGNEQQLVHRPHLGPDRGPVTCVYALAEFKAGGAQIELMAADEIEAVRKRSRAAQDGPWVTDYEEMSRKTVLRRLCKFLPFPTAFEDALATDDPADEQPRKPIDNIEIPDGVDTETGEILDETPDDVTGDIEEPEGPSLADQKAKLIDDIFAALNEKFPRGAPSAQAQRLKLSKEIFGTTILDDIAKQPLQILELGLQAIRSQIGDIDAE